MCVTFVNNSIHSNYRDIVASFTEIFPLCANVFSFADGAQKFWTCIFSPPDVINQKSRDERRIRGFKIAHTYRDWEMLFPRCLENSVQLHGSIDNINYTDYRPILNAANNYFFLTFSVSSLAEKDFCIEMSEPVFERNTILFKNIHDRISRERKVNYRFTDRQIRNVQINFSRRVE